MKKIQFMDTSFRDGFQSVIGARVIAKDFLPALSAAMDAGTMYFEVAGGARVQSPFFYCGENAFDMMDEIRKTVGPDVNLQSLARGVNVVGLDAQSSEMIDLHAKMFKKHGVTTVRNFDALNDIRNLEFSGNCVYNAGLRHEATITLMAGRKSFAITRAPMTDWKPSRKEVSMNWIFFIFSVVPLFGVVCSIYQ